MSLVVLFHVKTERIYVIFCAEIEKKCSFIKFSFSFGKYTDFHDISITNIQIHLAVTRLSYLYPSILIIYKKECGVVNLIVCSN